MHACIHACRTPTPYPYPLPIPLPLPLPLPLQRDTTKQTTRRKTRRSATSHKPVEYFMHTFDLLICIYIYTYMHAYIYIYIYIYIYMYNRMSTGRLAHHLCWDSQLSQSDMPIRTVHYKSSSRRIDACRCLLAQGFRASVYPSTRATASLSRQRTLATAK